MKDLIFYLNSICTLHCILKTKRSILHSAALNIYAIKMLSSSFLKHKNLFYTLFTYGQKCNVLCSRRKLGNSSIMISQKKKLYRWKSVGPKCFQLLFWLSYLFTFKNQERNSQSTAGTHVKSSLCNSQCSYLRINFKFQWTDAEEMMLQVISVWDATENRIYVATHLTVDAN